MIIMSSSQGKYIKRLDNFRWNSNAGKKLIEENDEYFEKLDFFEQYLLSLRSSAHIRHLIENSHSEQLLIEILLNIYNFLYDDAKIASVHDFGGQTLEDAIVGVYVFTVLCTFLHTSTRIKGKSYLDFIYEHRESGYNDSKSSNRYYKPEFINAADRFRKSRYRKLRQGKVFVPESKWAAVSVDLEHELTFHFAIEQGDFDLFDTYKRFGNLYNDILKVVDGDKSDAYEENLLKAEKKFLAKVRKIDYSKYLKLQQKIVDHIKSDDKYFGINLYRLERTMMPYRMTHDVKQLLSHPHNCRAETAYLLRASYLKEIPFPAIYNALLFSPVDANAVETYADIFTAFLRDANLISCLILDALIEENFFGNDWADTFRQKTNELAPIVLYDPAKLELNIPEGDAQEKFEKLLSFPVKLTVYNMTKNPVYFPMSQF